MVTVGPFLVVLMQVSLQHLPTMQAGGASGEAPLSGPNKMLSGLLAKATTQATGLLAKVRQHVGGSRWPVERRSRLAN